MRKTAFTNFNLEAPRQNFFHSAAQTFSATFLHMHKISLQKKHSTKQDTEPANNTTNQHILTASKWPTLILHPTNHTQQHTHQAILYFEIEPKETAT